MEMNSLATVSIIDDSYLVKQFNKGKAAILMSDCISDIEQAYPGLHYIATFARYMLSDHVRALSSLASQTRLIKTREQQQAFVNCLIRIFEVECIDVSVFGKDILLMLASRLLRIELGSKSEVKELNGPDLSKTYIRKHYSHFLKNDPINDIALALVLCDDGSKQNLKLMVDRSLQIRIKPWSAIQAVS